MRLPDVAVVGGGIVGLSTARALLAARPGLRVVLLEKEPGIARHQTGRNSGVIHSGIYYAPGSLKARYAIAGTAALLDYCARRGIAAEQCGKVIVATADAERPRLDRLAERAAAHGLALERLDARQLCEREPHVAGVAALHLPATGIVDYAQVAAAYRDDGAAAGAEIRTGAEVTEIGVDPGGVTLVTRSGPAIRARMLVNCAGLHSDRIARLAGLEPGARILPFRGEYFSLVPQRRFLVRNLVYPVPDPAFPFLGVHFTRGIGGDVHAGPNAVLALAREGYRPLAADRADLAELARFPGFWRLARRYWRTGAGEYARSLSRRAFVRGLQRLVPDVTVDDLVPAPPGIRAQAVRADGTLVDDFLIERGMRSLHVLNAPSPAATASLPIGEHVAAQALHQLG